MSRVDLFGIIHKGIRGLLFELSREAARADLTSTQAVDGLVAHVERTLGFLDEHAHLEETHVIPVLRGLDPVLAEELAREHRGLEVAQLEVERAADALALANLSLRVEAGAQLARMINHLVAVQLIHMNREETEVNAALWAGLGDGELDAIRTRSREAIPPARHREWLELLATAVNPVEHRLVLGTRVG